MSWHLLFLAYVVAVVTSDLLSKLCVSFLKRRDFRRLFSKLENSSWEQVRAVLEELGVIYNQAVRLDRLSKLKKTSMARVVGSIYHNEPHLRDDLMVEIVNTLGMDRKKLMVFGQIAGQRHREVGAILADLDAVVERFRDHEVDSETLRLLKRVKP